MKIKIILVILFFNSMFVFSQDDNKSAKSSKIFHAMGATFLADFVSSPVKIVPMYDYNKNINTNTFTKTYGINLGTYIYRFRYNFKEPSQESAFSFSLIPALGFGIVVPSSTGDDAGFFTFNLPLLVNYEYGAGSTYNSTKEHGFFFGAGIEYFKSPIFSVMNNSQGAKAISSFFMPVVSAGFRYWTRSNRLAEINFKVGKGFKTKLPDVYEGVPPSTLSPYEFRLSYLFFLKY